MTKISNKDAAAKIASRDPFQSHTGSFSGVSDPSAHSGRLAASDADLFQQDAGVIDYTVYSYATPIAWHTPDGWTVLGSRFSPTTSRHQSVVRRAMMMAV